MNIKSIRCHNHRVVSNIPHLTLSLGNTYFFQGWGKKEKALPWRFQLHAQQLYHDLTSSLLDFNR